MATAVAITRSRFRHEAGSVGSRAFTESFPYGILAGGSIERPYSFVPTGCQGLPQLKLRGFPQALLWQYPPGVNGCCYCLRQSRQQTVHQEVRFIRQRLPASETGYLLTRRFILQGNRLTINCDAVAPPYRDELTCIRVAVVQAPDLSRPLPRNEMCLGQAMPAMPRESRPC